VDIVQWRTKCDNMAWYYVLCSELLDEHNPWYCPRCRKNQCASKTMSVWRYPNTLVVQLKRLVRRISNFYSQNSSSVFYFIFKLLRVFLSFPLCSVYCIYFTLLTVTNSTIYKQKQAWVILLCNWHCFLLALLPCGW